MNRNLNETDDIYIYLFLGSALELERLAFANKHCYELLSDYGLMRNDFRYYFVF